MSSSLSYLRIYTVDVRLAVRYTAFIYLSLKKRLPRRGSPMHLFLTATILRDFRFTGNLIPASVYGVIQRTYKWAARFRLTRYL